MNADRWLTVAFGAVTVIALVAAWRWRPRKTRMLFAWEATRLIPAGTPAGIIEMTFRGVPVQAPWIVQVSLSNAGPRDISADQFDRGAPLEIHLGATVLGVAETDGAPPLVAPSVGSDAPLLMEPALLKSGETWTVNVVVEGSPRVSVEGRLANVLLVERTRNDILEITASALAAPTSLVEIIVSGIEPIAGGVAALVEMLADLFAGRKWRR